VMLETIREYGLEVLATSEEMETTRQAHAVYYLRLAEETEPELRGPHQAIWFERLEREHDNLRAALTWLLGREEVEMTLRLSGALYWFWFVRGPVSEGWTFLERALVRSEGVAVSVRAKALWVAGNLTGLLSNEDRAEALWKESLTLFQQIGDKAGMGNASFHLGIVAWWKSQLAVARSRYEESLALFREIGDKRGIGWSLYELAEVTLIRANTRGPARWSRRI